MYYNNIRLQSIYRNRLFYKRYNKLSIPIPKPLPHGKGLCMLCWLCICAIVVVCCRCVLHRLCSTTCMRPCIEPLGVLSRHPCRNPKPLSLGERQCMLGWFCIVQSLWAYTPGVRAGAECGAAALTPLGATPQTPFCATAAHKNSPDFSSGEFLLIDRGDVYKLSLYLAGAVSLLR